MNPSYSESEERLNIYSHGFGLILSLVAFPMLIYKATKYADIWEALALVSYGFSLVLLYAASTLYHASKTPKKRRLFNVLDHAAIFILIAGTYAPYTLLAVGGEVGWLLFKLTWLFALLGVVLKIFFTGKFNFLSTVLYVLMGWQIVFAATPFLENNPLELVLLVFLGGISYTLGAILYSIDKIPFNHAIFHVFVLVGSICHFWGCYVYL